MNDAELSHRSHISCPHLSCPKREFGLSSRSTSRSRISRRLLIQELSLIESKLYNYFKISLLWIDDEVQLRSVVINMPQKNDLICAMKMSLFHRFKILGHSSTLLRQQHRLIFIIDDMISKLFYDGKLVNGQNTVIEARPLWQVVANFNHEQYDFPNSRIVPYVDGLNVLQIATNLMEVDSISADVITNDSMDIDALEKAEYQHLKLTEKRADRANEIAHMKERERQTSVNSYRSYNVN